MSDEGLTFDAALRQYSDDVLDDLAHGRPNRYGTMAPDFCGPCMEGDDPATPEPLIFTYPVPWCLGICTECDALFAAGDIIHPGKIVSDHITEWRCIACFKAQLRRAVEAMAESFRLLVAGTDEHRKTTDEATRTMTVLADTLTSLDFVAGECFRCGQTTRDEDAIGTPCQSTGCSGIYIKAR